MWSSSVADHPTGQAIAVLERVEQFFATPDYIAELVLVDEQRRATLVATFLIPATVT